MAVRYFYMPLDTFRFLTSNDIPNAANNGGLLAKDTTPRLERTNLATDPSLRVAWPAGSQEPIVVQVSAHQNTDITQPILLGFLAKMSGSTDTPAFTIDFREQSGGSNIGGTTAVLGPTLQTVMVAIVPTVQPPTEYNITITPGVHATDEIYLHAAFGEYTALNT